MVVVVVVVVVSHIQRIGCQPEKLLYTVANPARGLLNREKRTKEEVWQHPPSPLHPPHCSFGEKNKIKNHATHLQALLRSRSVSRPYKDIFGSSTRHYANGSGFAKLYTPVCDNMFPSLVASLIYWRCLAASTSSFLHTAMNLRPPSVTVSTHTSAFNAVASQSPAMPNARMSLRTQSVHSFSFPPRLLRTAPSRFPKTIRFGSRPPLIWRSVPAHKSLLVRNVVSTLSHRVISRARLYEVIPWSGLLRCAPMIRRRMMGSSEIHTFET